MKTKARRYAQVLLLSVIVALSGCDSSGDSTPVAQSNASPVTEPTREPSSTPSPSPTTPPPPLNLGPSVLVANRDSGSVSIIDTSTDIVSHTINLPAGADAPLASYISYSVTQDQFYVGDDRNDRIWVFDGETLEHVDTFVMSQDVFHMWNNESQLWAVDRSAEVVTVFDLAGGNKLADVPIPADLEALGGQPHDVVADSTHAYVTVSQVAGNDFVVKYSTTTFTEVDRAPVGEDPHVILHPTDNRVFVACQDTDNVFVFDRTTMTETNEIPLLGGHGVWIPNHGQALYVTNFPSHVTGGSPGPGANGLFSVNLGTETESGAIATNPQAHNVVSTPDGNKLYLTHSNGAGLVTVFDTSNPDRVPRNPVTISVGETPFGIAFMP